MIQEALAWTMSSSRLTEAGDGAVTWTPAEGSMAIETVDRRELRVML
jgi:hypothetical protein